MKREPNPAVKEWVNKQAIETLYLSTIVLAELLFGVAALPTGKRKSKLIAALNGVTDLSGDRVLLFDIPTAHVYARLMAEARLACRLLIHGRWGRAVFSKHLFIKYFCWIARRYLTRMALG